MGSLHFLPGPLNRLHGPSSNLLSALPSSPLTGTPTTYVSRDRPPPGHRDDRASTQGPDWHWFSFSALPRPQKLGGGCHWGILNLKHLNLAVLYCRFKMHSLRSILSSIRRGDFLQSMDLCKAYLHVPIHPSHRHFLGFEYAGGHYQYCAMPFGLSSAPRTFTKLVSAVAAALRLEPMRTGCYLDDILVFSSSQNRARRDMDLVLAAFHRHGFSINLAKSQLIPSTSILHVGAVIDSIKGQVFLSPDPSPQTESRVSRT